MPRTPTRAGGADPAFAGGGDIGSGAGGGGGSGGGGGDSAESFAKGLAAFVAAAEAAGSDMLRAEASQCLLTISLQVDPGDSRSHAKACTTAAAGSEKTGGAGAASPSSSSREASLAYGLHLLSTAIDVKAAAEAQRFLMPCLEEQRNHALLTSAGAPEGSAY